MDRDEALKFLKGGREGVREWNRIREAGVDSALDLPSLNGADLTGADLGEANLFGMQLRRADLSGASLWAADVRNAFLSDACLARADLGRANFGGAEVSRADFDAALCQETIFGCLNLSTVTGLGSVTHLYPSTIGIDTLVLSEGNIPEAFLRGCGVPDALIEYLPALLSSMQPIQFYSCFISYSTKDNEFARRLHSKMREQNLRVWFAPEDMQGGKKLHEQVERAIQVHDRLLLVLSDHSIESQWVRDEIRRARQAEVREGRKKLFPIRLIPYESVVKWKSFYADLAEDLAAEIREYFIPDFSNWKDHDSFEAAFARLLKDLKADHSAGAKSE
jgi:TIR domain/Pentapeptide repeats (8 copies)